MELNGITLSVFLSLLSLILLGGVLYRYKQLHFLALAFEHLPKPIIITDQRARILKVNRAFYDITGYPRQEVIGQTPAVFNSGRQGDDFYRRLWHELQRTGYWQGEVWNKRKNGDEYAERFTISTFQFSFRKRPYYVGTLTDISQNKEDEATIERLAFYDTLTRLPNRKLLENTLQKALKKPNETNTSGAVLFIDLDDFKSLNDTCGHGMGDLLLVEVARRIHACLDFEDATVGRWGSDEFVVILENLTSTLALNDAIQQAEWIQGKLSEPFTLNGLEYFSACCIGIALFDHRHSAQELLKKADSALHHAKRSGRNCIYTFDPSIQQALVQKLELEKDLRHALKEDQFELYLQPQLNSGGCLVGAEALIRWNHPQKGMISPADFIPLAEKNGLIVGIGDWVQEEACRLLAGWKTHPILAKTTLSINVSEQQLRHPDFVEKTLNAMKQYQIRPTQLKLEITESAVMLNLDECADKLCQLKQHGLEFSMDDFGTGYSSLSNIRALPLDQLKIDQSFVRNLLEDKSNQTLTQTIITMSEALDLEIIAEGVETEGQKIALEEMGCHFFQGYYFAKPLAYPSFITYAESIKE
jgi:diguanylate cyclase (GGDEF)-like protein/PAS domain S-box-containing protein